MTPWATQDDGPRKRRRRRRHSLSNKAICGLLISLAGVTANAQVVPSGRWGQASTVSGTTLLVHGGKVDPSNSMSYTSAPNTNDLFSLDLSTSFDVTNPPWVYESGSQDASTSQGPAVAFHTLTSYTNKGALIFGGDGGPTMPIETNADSAWILDSSKISWTWQPANWGGEPIRRIYHSAASNSKNVWITGGQKADGSGLGFDDTIEFSGSVSNGAFTTLPAPNGTLPLDLLGHRSVMLSSGMLFVLGGYSPSQSALISMSVLHYLDTTSDTPTWGNLTLQGAVPSPRRNFAIALLANNQILIHGGGDATLQNLYADGAILNMEMTPISWVAAPGLDATLGPLIDHMAVGVGNSVLFGFGHGPNGPAAGGLNLYNSDTGTFSNSYNANVNSPTQTAISGPTSTIPGYTSAASWPATIATGLIPGQSYTASAVPSETIVPGGNSDGEHDGHHEATIIAVSTVFGVAAVAVLLLVALWLLFRRRQGSPHRSHLLWDPRSRHHPLPGSGDSEDPELLGGKSHRDIPVVGGRWSKEAQTRSRWGFLPMSFNKRGANEPSRFDMFHDEDARTFGHSPGATGSSFAPSRPAFKRFGSSTRQLWNGVLNASTASLKAIGLGGDGTTTPAAVDRNSSPDWWEKTHDPFADDAVALAAVPGVTAVGMNLASRHRGGGSHSQGTSYGSLSTYNDPFTDELGAHSRMSSTSSRGYYPEVHRADSFQPFLLPIEDEPPQSSLRIPSDGSGPSRGLTLTPSLLTPGTMASSDISNYMSSTPTSVESSGHSGPKSSTPGLPPSLTSLIGSAPTTPIKRSDSWWDRFGRASLSSLTRQVSGGDRGSINPIRRISVRNNGSSNAYAALDFRDPNPPPRLSGIEETGKSNEPSPQNSADAKKSSGGAVDPAGNAHHRKSLSSMKTADSEALERMAGRLDVMQRGRTNSSEVSITPAHSINEDYEYGGARLVTVHGAMASASSMGDQRPPHRKGTSSSGQLVSPPLTDSPGLVSSPGMSTEETYQTAQSRPGVPQRESSESYKTAQSRASALNVPQRKQTGKGVADRVAIFEGMTMTQSPPTSPVDVHKFPSNRGADFESKRKSAGVSYGLAQRPSLFVANPDRRIGSGSTTSDTTPPAT